MATRAAWLAARLLPFAMWAALLGVAGLAAVLGPGTGLVGRADWRWLGFAALCAGQYVFMATVADRLFPYVHRRLASLAEAALFAGLLVGAGGFVVSMT